MGSKFVLMYYFSTVNCIVIEHQVAGILVLCDISYQHIFRMFQEMSQWLEKMVYVYCKVLGQTQNSVTAFHSFLTVPKPFKVIKSIPPNVFF